MDNIQKLYELKKPTEMRSLLGGNQLIYSFKNGYGASVICHKYSCGGDDGLLELAVLGNDGNIDYDTPIANDVVGYLDAEEAFDLLDKIEKL